MKLKCSKIKGLVWSFIILFFLWGCIPKGVGPTPRELRKRPELRKLNRNIVYPDSLLPKKKLLEFPYRNIDEIKLNWKVVAGIDLSGREIKKLRKLIKKNVTQYWSTQYPGDKIPSLALENVSVM